jgi:L-seryl-tRNA(Ser) seleniumtransferase
MNERNVGVYRRLGVRPVVNARGTSTISSGSLMARVVLEAMAEAATAYVDMAELHARAGERIATLVGAQAAHVTAGSASGLLLAAAACMAGTDPARIRQLPDTTGLAAEKLVIQRCQRFQYDQALRTSGAQLVEAGDSADCRPEQLEAAIDPRTAALIFVVYPPLAYRGLPVERMSEIAHRHGLPLIVDAASALPPLEHLHYWTDCGADLVVFSGGKGVRGPAGTGIVIGRPDLIAAVAANAAPNTAIGRPCKVGKEEIVGLVTALEIFMTQDHDAEWQRHADEARHIAAAVSDLPGVCVRIEDDRAFWSAPTVVIGLDERLTSLTPHKLLDALRWGEPPIMTRIYPVGDPNGDLAVDPHCLRHDEADLVAQRLTAELRRPSLVY